jgi:pimeloyl-ACP methyl ester carboxylesterase
MPRRDAGLANDYWKRYYTPAEVREIEDATTTTTIVSGGLPIHVRLYEQAGPAPTLLVSHGLITYGLILARLQLPFFRAGFNVVQWDMPGWGQSGGPRGGCTIEQSIQAWRDAFDWTTGVFAGPFFANGYGEDGTTCYYALANDPRLSAMSFHNLWDYGDPDIMRWQGPPWLVRGKRALLSVARYLLPTRTVDMRKGVPWDDLFGKRGLTPYRDIFEHDPLRNHGYQYPLAYSMLRQHRPRVRFEECRTPVQLVPSELNELWPLALNLRSYARLGGPKELVTLAGKPHWEFTVEFEEAFCAIAMRWFQQHGASLAPAHEDA